MAINAEKVMRFLRDPKFRNIIENAALPSPDGAGAVIGMKWLHKRSSIKLDLPKLTLQIANANKMRLFVFGAKEEINQTAVATIRDRYPDIQIVGRRNGFFESEAEIEEMLLKAQPDLVMIALGTPKQEILAVKLNKSLPHTFFIGCGGALDALAGTVQRAPSFFVNNNLEWFYRLVQQPARIKRQKVLPVFMMKLMQTYLTRKISN